MWIELIVLAWESFMPGPLIWAFAISALDTATLCKEAWDVAPYLF